MPAGSLTSQSTKRCMFERSGPGWIPLMHADGLPLMRIPAVPYPQHCEPADVDTRGTMVCYLIHSKWRLVSTPAGMDSPRILARRSHAPQRTVAALPMTGRSTVLRSLILQPVAALVCGYCSLAVTVRKCGGHPIMMHLQIRSPRNCGYSRDDGEYAEKSCTAKRDQQPGRDSHSIHNLSLTPWGECVWCASLS